MRLKEAKGREYDVYQSLTAGAQQVAIHPTMDPARERVLHKTQITPAMAKAATMVSSYSHWPTAVTRKII